MKLWFETKLEKFGGPLRDHCGPPQCRGLPVEKHWSRVMQTKIVENECNI